MRARTKRRKLGRGALRHCAAVMTSLLAGVLPAGADPVPAMNEVDLTELSPDEVQQIKVHSVYGASKREQRVSEAPASVSIVDADEIKRYGYRTLGDILQSVRGMNPQEGRTFRVKLSYRF